MWLGSVTVWYGIDNDNLCIWLANARGYLCLAGCRRLLSPSLTSCRSYLRATVCWHHHRRYCRRRPRRSTAIDAAGSPRYILHTVRSRTSIYEMMMATNRQHTMMKVLEQICVVANAPSVSLKMPSSGHQFFLLSCIAFMLNTKQKKKEE